MMKVVVMPKRNNNMAAAGLVIVVAAAVLLLLMIMISEGPTTASSSGQHPPVVANDDDQAEEKMTTTMSEIIVRRQLLSSKSNKDDDDTTNILGRFLERVVLFFYPEVCEESVGPQRLQYFTRHYFFFQVYLGVHLGFWPGLYETNRWSGSCAPICQDLCDKDGFKCGVIKGVTKKDCSCLADEPLGTFQQYSSVRDAVDLYCNGGDERKCIEEKHGPIELWDTSNVWDMFFVFGDEPDCNPNITKWDTSSVIGLWRMFENAETFNQPIDGWNVTSVTSMDEMFNGATAFNQNLCSWGQKINLTTTRTTDMFVGMSCPNTQDPNLTATPPSPFCYDC